MPAGGQNIKSTAQKIKDGTYRRDRDYTSQKLGQLIKEIPDPPETLSDKGRDVWYSICQDLIISNVLFSIDLIQLETLVYNICDYWENEIELRILKPGSVVEMDREDFDRYKFLKSHNRQLLQVIRSMANDFGMTPTGRRGFNVKLELDKKDPVLALM